MKLRVLSLFAGIGGFDLGLERTGGFETTGFCEIDEYASRVLKQWWPDVPNEQRGIIALNALLRRARTSSPPASRVRTYPLLGAAPALPEPVRDSCGLYFEPFAWFDRNARCWRTWQRCLVEGWETYSGTWPRSGMTRNGIAYRRQPLVRLTSATGSSSPLPTPEASNTKAVALRSAGRSPGNFLAPLWPTPSVSGNYNRKGASATSGDGLATAVKNAPWPTPRASDGSKGGTLTEAVSARETFPTPSSRDWKGGARPETLIARGKSPNNTLPDMIEQDGGALNPTWVEWLMGFPLGWTAFAASVTRSSRKSSKSSAARFSLPTPHHKGA